MFLCPCLWLDATLAFGHQGREEPLSLSPVAWAVLALWLILSVLPALWLLSLFSCWMLYPLEALSYAFPFPSLQRGRADFLRLECPRSSCPRSQPVPPTHVPLAPFIVYRSWLAT